MKKLIAALFAAVLMAAGLVTFTSGTATAACPYTGCIASDSEVTGTTALKSGNNPRFTISVERAGNTKAAANNDPKGTVRLVIKRKGGGFSATRNVYYGGSAKTIVGPKLFKLGTYTATIRFIPAANSRYSGSVDTKVIKVKPRG